MTSAAYPPTLGAILAGGLASRMGGGDKCLQQAGGRPILSWQIERLGPQVRQLIINANGAPGRFSAFGLRVVPDTIPGSAGPLAGVLAALEWAASAVPDIDWVVTVPGDVPFLPLDLVSRLHAARQQGSVVQASSGGRTHPVVALWPVAIRDTLRAALDGEGLRKAGVFAARHGGGVADWPVTPADPFFNVNTRDDLRQADQVAALLARGGQGTGRTGDEARGRGEVKSPLRYQ
jgi:molybdopterin-guanine dinucleotide biosynthesis protein A